MDIVAGLLILVCMLFGGTLGDGAPIFDREDIYEHHNHDHELDESFLTDIGFQESGNDYTKVNSYGMLGKYQFSPKTLRGLGYKISDSTFLHTPELQEEAMQELLKHNEKILRRVIKKYENTNIKDIEITKSGILAAAHLVGPRAVKRWLRSNGKVTRIDGYGTSIENYMNKFKNYNIEI